MSIPAQAGIGFRTQHSEEFINSSPNIAWVEVHVENYFVEGGPRLRVLEAVRENYPLSLHGVGLSLGSSEGLDSDHLEWLQTLVGRFEPGLVSEHIAWSTADDVYYNDLLPLPYTEESLDTLCRNIDHLQNLLGRRILVENPTTYLQFKHSTIPEWEFLSQIVKRSGCGLLLDVNNIHVSAVNHTFNAEAYLDSLPLTEVQEIHLAGHTVQSVEGQTILIDDHSCPVSEPVWDLFRGALKRLGAVPTLIEWDTNIPELSVLLAQAKIAEDWLDEVRGSGHVS